MVEERQLTVDSNAQVRTASDIVLAMRKVEELDRLWRQHRREYVEARKAYAERLNQAVSDFEAQRDGTPYQPTLLNTP